MLLLILSSPGGFAFEPFGEFGDSGHVERPFPGGKMMTVSSRNVLVYAPSTGGASLNSCNVSRLPAL